MRRFEDYHATPVTKADVRSWGRAVPWWVPRIGLVVLGAAGVAAGLIGDDTGRCSTTDPTVCGPDSVFAVFLGFLVLTAFLLWFVPRIGCVVGAAVGVTDVLLDDVLASRVVFGGFAIACLAVVIAMRADDLRSRRVLTERAGPRLVRCPPGLTLPGWSPLIALAGVLAVLGVAGFLWCAHLQKVERGHLARAQETTATVSKVDEDGYAVQVRLADGGTRPVDTLDYYDKGDELPVLIDPEDRSWARPVAEPYDPTYWQTGGTIALGLVSVLAWRELSLRHWRRLAPERDLPAVSVRVDLDPEVDSADLFVAGAHAPFATLSTLPTWWPGSAHQRVDADAHDDAYDWYDEHEPDSLAEAWRSAPGPAVRETEDGILLGDLGPGGLAMILLRDRVLWPDGGLRVVRVAPRWWRSLRLGPRAWLNGDRATEDAPRAPFEEDPDFPGRPAGATDGPLPELPFTARPRLGHIRLSWLKAAAFGLAAVGVVALSIGDLDVYLLLVGLGGMASSAFTAWVDATARMVVDGHGLTMWSYFVTHRIPWSAVHGVRVDDEGVWVGWEPDNAMGFGPVDDPEALAGRVEALRAHFGPLDHRVDDRTATGHGYRGPATRHLRLDALVIPTLTLVGAAVAVLLR